MKMNDWEEPSRKDHGLLGLCSHPITLSGAIPVHTVNENSTLARVNEGDSAVPIRAVAGSERGRLERDASC